MDEETFKKIARVVLLVWFIVVGLLILIPSGWLFLAESGPSNKRDKTPPPPVAPATKEVAWLDPKEPVATLTQRVEAYKQQVLLYGQLEQVYEKQTAAYGKYLDQSAKDQCYDCPQKFSEVYTLVVKDTLVPLVNSFLAALFGYIFINVGAQLVRAHLRSKNNQSIDPIRLL